MFCLYRRYVPGQEELLLICKQTYCRVGLLQNIRGRSERDILMFHCVSLFKSPESPQYFQPSRDLVPRQLLTIDAVLLSEPITRTWFSWYYHVA